MYAVHFPTCVVLLVVGVEDVGMYSYRFNRVINFRIIEGLSIFLVMFLVVYFRTSRMPTFISTYFLRTFTVSTCAIYL